MRPTLLASPVLLTPLQAAAQAVAREGGVAVESGPGPLTPWLALASVGLVATLIAAQWLVSRSPRR